MLETIITNKRLTNQKAVDSCVPAEVKKIEDLSIRLKNQIYSRSKRKPNKDEFSLCLGIFTLLDGLEEKHFLLSGFSKILAVDVKSFKHFRLLLSEQTFWYTRNSLCSLCEIISFLSDYMDSTHRNIHKRYINCFENYLSEVVELPKDL